MYKQVQTIFSNSINKIVISDIKISPICKLNIFIFFLFFKVQTRQKAVQTIINKKKVY